MNTQTWWACKWCRNIIPMLACTRNLEHSHQGERYRLIGLPTRTKAREWLKENQAPHYMVTP